MTCRCGVDGDWRVVQRYNCGSVICGNSFVVCGNSSVIYGNSFVVYGNSSVVYGNIFVIYGNGFVIYGNNFAAIVLATSYSTLICGKPVVGHP